MGALNVANSRGGLASIAVATWRIWDRWAVTVGTTGIDVLNRGRRVHQVGWRELEWVALGVHRLPWNFAEAPVGVGKWEVAIVGRTVGDARPWHRDDVWEGREINNAWPGPPLRVVGPVALGIPVIGRMRRRVACEPLETALRAFAGDRYKGVVEMTAGMPHTSRRELLRRGA